MDIKDKINVLRNNVPEDIYFSDSEDLMAFYFQNHLVDKSMAPECILRPGDVNTLQEVMREANQNEINLTVSSSGSGHRKGGFVSALPHAHIDLSGSKKIDWIDRRNRVCQLEPGVTYGELVNALKPYGMTVSMPLAPRKGKSVVAAVTDREPSTWPNKQWDISDPVASTEFVFGNGEIFRTGAAGGPGSLGKQRASGGAQKCPLGPSQADFHRVIQGAQGTMGIVSWITLRTELIPQVRKTYFIGANDLNALVPFVYEVQRPWLGEHSFLLDKFAAAFLLSGTGRGEYNSVLESLPEYLCLQNIAGFETLAEERVAYQFADIKDISSRHKLEMVNTLGKVHADKLFETATTPCGDVDWRCSLKGDCLSVFFLTTLDRVSGLESVYRKISEKNGFGRNETGIYVQPIVQNHACHVEFMTSFNPSNEEDLKKIQAVEKEAVWELAAKGAFFSRPYGTAGKIVFDQNPGNYDLLKKVKDIFDPNQILNKGKWGL